MQKPQAQGGARLLAFHAPPCADFLRFLSAIDFGTPLARLVKTTIFFKLQTGVSLVSSAPPPHPHRPVPHPRHTQIKRLKSLYCWGEINRWSCIAGIIDKLAAMTKKHQRLYYDGWVWCNDPMCGLETGQLSVFEGCCLKQGCNGLGDEWIDPQS